jgi:hypothetical protein
VEANFLERRLAVALMHIDGLLRLLGSLVLPVQRAVP